ncbi:MAG: uroporphyrinogen-III synthase [Rhabdochlamydiaceae bacterium]|nr:uroporphyrinogen-III synthase [Rhabdochlamydiaceae bacterium]
MKRMLYLGTDPSSLEDQDHVIHCPLIQIVARSVEEEELLSAYRDLPAYTHILFTSKNAVRIFFEHLIALNISKQILNSCHLIAIGAVTAAYLKVQGCPAHFVSEVQTQEGLVSLLQTLPLESAYLFLPRSSLSRPVLVQFLEQSNVRYLACDLYQTITCVPKKLPDLSQIDEILFTSPSTVRAFIEVFGALPRDKKLLAIGPITRQALNEIVEICPTDYDGPNLINFTG